MTSRSVFRHALTASVVLTLSGLAFAGLLKVDAAKSRIGFVFKQMNVPVEGKFRKFDAQVNYNAAQPAASKVNISVDVTSFDVGDPKSNKEARTKTWFNVLQFPKATFVSTSIQSTAPGKLNIDGKLTIKGKTVDVTFPMTVTKDGNNFVFDGSLPIKRLAFNIGEGEWKDTSTIADEVVIKFHVVTTQ